MNETLILAPAFLAGVLLGTMVFAGLWWTVEKGVASPRPAVWFLASQFLRMGIALGGFYLLAHGHWERLLASLFGFVIARFIVTRLVAQPCYCEEKEVGHAPDSR